MRNLVLFDTESGRIVDYPRADDELVQQLDPRYVVLRVMREAKPEPQEGFAVQPTRTVDLEAGEWRWGWELVELPPPIPDYQGFYQALLISEVYGAVLSQEATADLARAIAVFVSAIQDALNDRVNNQALQGAIWLLLSKLALQPQHLAELQALMVQFHLNGAYSLFPMPPAESVGQTWDGPDGSQWEVVQARDANGTFAEDDPTTAERESLQWMEVQS